MKADSLLALYDRVAQAPDAVDRLRRFVLDLAVRGNLVEQDPTDEPASALLERIAAAKVQMVKAGEIRAKKPLPDNTHDMASMSLPAGWSSVRLAEITVCLDYMRRPVNANERAKRIEGKNRDELFPYYGATQQQGWIDDYLFDEELVLLGEDGVPFHDPHRQKAYIIRGKTWVNNHAHVFRGILISHPYLVHVLNVFDYSGRVAGATRPKLNQTRALGMPIPLPPLAEQRRIVARVDELTALCHRLEETRAVRTDTRDRLTRASLARLTAPDADGSASRAHAQFAVNSLPQLTTRAEQVRHLRQSILSLAVQGKLTSQHPSDEPASALLRRIAAEKERIVRAGEARTPRSVPEADADEVPFHLPQGWAWTQIANLGFVRPRNEAPNDLRAAFVPMSLIAAEYGAGHEQRTRPWGAIKRGYTHFSEGDVGLAKITPCFENGKSTVFRNLTGGIGSGTTELHVVRPLFVLADYIVLFLKSSHFIEPGIASMTGTAGQKRVPSHYFTSSPFPLPPLAEQERIVVKVNELMAFCDRIEVGLATSDVTRSRLLESLLHNTLLSLRNRSR